jgi:N-acetylmuramoyl-L-alanine amidase
MKRVFALMLALLMLLSGCKIAKVPSKPEDTKRTRQTTESTERTTRKSKTEATTEPTTEPPTEQETTQAVEVIEVEEEEVEPVYAMDDEVELLSLVTVAEAEGESEEGKRLVIDAILNRVDSGYFPNTISGVIYEPNQFTSMWNGRADSCYGTDDIRQLVREELNSRTNYDVIFFSAGGYSAYGTPLFQVGNHYFSSYE